MCCGFCILELAGIESNLPIFSLLGFRTFSPASAELHWASNESIGPGDFHRQSHLDRQSQPKLQVDWKYFLKKFAHPKKSGWTPSYPRYAVPARMALLSGGSRGNQEFSEVAQSGEINFARHEKKPPASPIKRVAR